MITRQPTADDVRARRTTAGLTQARAAKLCGVTVTAWEHYEGGRRSMGAPAWRLFCVLTDPRPGRAANKLIKDLIGGMK